MPGTDVPDDDATWMTVIGVTRDVKHYGMDEDMTPGVYQPVAQFPLNNFRVAMRTEGDLTSILSGVRAVTSELDAELPVHGIELMVDELNESLLARRATSWLFGIFSVVALLMAIAGIYGVISYTVGQRSQEISIRMAMGADTGIVIKEVVVQGMRLVLVGAAVGIVLSLAGANAVSRILVGVSAKDPLVYVIVTGVVLIVATAANYVPARRAAGLDPMRALRGE